MKGDQALITMVILCVHPEWNLDTDQKTGLELM